MQRAKAYDDLLARGDGYVKACKNDGKEMERLRLFLMYNEQRSKGFSEGQWY